MHLCFECGGVLKLISKPGRMTWDGDLLYEIPPELKISACIECGQPHEDDFLKARLQKIIEAQKKVKPSTRLLCLRWVDTSLDRMLKRPAMYGDCSSVAIQACLLLQFREMLLSKGEEDHGRKILDTMHRFLQKRWPEMGCLWVPSDVDLNTEFAPALKEFCDVWINTTVC